MARDFKLLQALGTAAVFIAACPVLVKPVAALPVNAHPSLVCPTVSSNPQNPEELCEAIEDGCLEGCERGADILVRWGLLEESDIEAYVDDCMVRHCDSPCKPASD